VKLSGTSIRLTFLIHHPMRRAGQFSVATVMRPTRLKLPAGWAIQV